MRRIFIALALSAALLVQGVVWADDFTCACGSDPTWEASNYSDAELMADHDTTPIDSSVWDSSDCCSVTSYGD